MIARWLARISSVVFLTGSLSGYGQDVGVPPQPGAVSGRAKTIAIERVYVRVGGRNIGEKVEQLTAERYDIEGRIVEAVQYGNGYVRTLYKYVSGQRTAEVGFFDHAGSPIKETEFKPAFDDVLQVDLCPNYSVRLEEDKIGKIERRYEICGDGSERARAVIEFDQKGNMVRTSRTDAKSRRWEEAIDYDADENVIEYRFTIASGSKPYTHLIRYSDYKFDDNRNWIRVTATSFNSLRPDVLQYQYNEHRRIVYFPDP